MLDNVLLKFLKNSAKFLNSFFYFLLLRRVDGLTSPTTSHEGIYIIAHLWYREDAHTLLTDKLTSCY